MKQLLKYISIAVCCVALTSCEKELSEPPANARVEGTAITDQRSAQVALNGVYYRFANVTSENITYWRSHHIPGGLLSGMLGYGFGAGADEENNNASSGYTGGIWSENYLMINAANGVIEGVNTLADNKFAGKRKIEIVAESRFLRAYGHFKLLTYFAEWNNLQSKNGVLIRDKFTVLSEVQKTRSTVADTYTQILTDLDFAITNAPVSNQGLYATKWAAMALKMRVLLTRGQQADFPEANTLGNTLISTGPHKLEPNLKDVFHSKGLSSTEVLLGVKAQAGQELLYSNLSNSYLPESFSLFAAKQTLIDLFSDDDPRKSWMFGALPPYDYISPGLSAFQKYVPSGGLPTQLSETSYAFRLSEVYLMRAEALLRAASPDIATAKTLVKTVMGTAGVTDFSSIDNAGTVAEMRLQTFYETARNLTGEDGIEWLALMRLPFAQVQQLRPTITTAVQFYFPVPLNEFDSNPLFGDQNQGYAR
jgi:hypothetical protein